MTSSAVPTDVHPARRVPVCGVQTTLAPDLVAVTLAFEGAAGARAEYVEVHLRCVLQAHADGEHHGFVMELDGHDSGAVWATWTDEPPKAVEVRPDCPAVSSPECGSQPCCEFACGSLASPAAQWVR
jgi:hypothetical protein